MQWLGCPSSLGSKMGMAEASLRNDSHTTTLATLKWEYTPLPIRFIKQICFYRVCSKIMEHSAGPVQETTPRSLPHSSSHFSSGWMSSLVQTRRCTFLGYQGRSVWRSHHVEPQVSGLSLHLW